ncbi:glycoside hydrolase family 10 protein [Algivirga pacifica]|uniref:Family 10 glycosylhydrolase n=1 Tax=Algivirga pacifica TaxID=1162670 RepID=A0ABP9DHB6_9BACT
MQLYKYYRVLTTLLLLLFTSPLWAQYAYPKREFRGVWVATLDNIDWPSKQGLSADEQKKEFISLLDFHKLNGMNAVIVQVRSEGDALYPSKYTPWSKSLSGKQGVSPTPYYNPLRFMISEAHKRGMEFHAWINPFRALSNYVNEDPAYNHITRSHPEWIITYGDLKIINPGIPAARRHIIKVIKELLMDYDIDALHIDDYFYPYPIKGASLSDYSTYKTYRGAYSNIADWRRHNINEFIKDVHEVIVKNKPMVKFGVSPFGVWRNQKESKAGSPTNSAYTCYDHLYADTRLWLQKGWIDYIAPQAYQNTSHKRIPYQPLIEWWAKNTFGKHLYVGHATYRVGNKYEDGWDSNKEIPTQVRINRSNKAHGSIMYNSSSLLMNRQHVTDSIRNNLFYVPALPPRMPWIDNVPPNKPYNVQVSQTTKGVVLTWQAPIRASDGDTPSYYVIYSTKSRKPDINNPLDILAVIPASQRYYFDTEARSTNSFYYAITSLDRLFNESIPVIPDNKKNKNSAVITSGR